MFIPENHNFESFDSLLWLATPTPHPKFDGAGYEELDYIKEAFDDNWLSTEGENIRVSEKLISEKIGVKYAVGLSCGTAALHLAMKIAGERLYGKSDPAKGALFGRRVFCSDMTFGATVNPVVYEGGTPVFIDTEYDTWNMDPIALEKAFEIYPEVKLIVVAHLYGTPGKIDKIREIADKHGALIVEDAAESLGAAYKGSSTGDVWRQTGAFGDVAVISFNGNKIITGSSGGMLLTDDEGAANKVRKWATQSREAALWYQHEELGYNYRMSNVIAGMIRGQIPWLEKHIEQKKDVWERYREGLKGLPVKMNPIDFEKSVPNYWLSCLLIDEDAMCKTVRGECEALYVPEHGKSCPTEILERLLEVKAQGRPIWKPMHMQSIYRMNGFVGREGDGRGRTNAYIKGGMVGKDGKALDVGMDIFHRGLCLPSDNKMNAEQQDRVIEVVRACFE
ncbi:MAG: DegT/DnrJ/EryC1/StrS family aminotransferase [Dorea sp.]|nr:DegT/DnrJ/EryC1/StrS family aminotransferase [Dorea sp.]